MSNTQSDTLPHDGIQVQGERVRITDDTPSESSFQRIMSQLNEASSQPDHSESYMAEYCETLNKYKTLVKVISPHLIEDWSEIKEPDDERSTQVVTSICPKILKLADNLQETFDGWICSNYLPPTDVIAAQSQFMTDNVDRLEGLQTLFRGLLGHRLCSSSIKGNAPPLFNTTVPAFNNTQDEVLSSGSSASQLAKQYGRDGGKVKYSTKSKSVNLDDLQKEAGKLDEIINQKIGAASSNQEAASTNIENHRRMSSSSNPFHPDYMTNDAVESKITSNSKNNLHETFLRSQPASSKLPPPVPQMPDSGKGPMKVNKPSEDIMLIDLVGDQKIDPKKQLGSEQQNPTDRIKSQNSEEFQQLIRQLDELKISDSSGNKANSLPQSTNLNSNTPDASNGSQFDTNSDPFNTDFTVPTSILPPITSAVTTTNTNNTNPFGVPSSVPSKVDASSLFNPTLNKYPFGVPATSDSTTTTNQLPVVTTSASLINSPGNSYSQSGASSFSDINKQSLPPISNGNIPDTSSINGSVDAGGNQQSNQLIQAFISAMSQISSVKPIAMEPLQIPSFSGRMEEYHNWKDYVVTTMEEMRMSSSLRTKYIWNKLDKETQRRLQHIDINSPDSYEKLWKELDSMFDRKELLKTHCVGRLLELATWKEASTVVQVRALHDYVVEYLNKLRKATGDPKEGNSYQQLLYRLCPNHVKNILEAEGDGTLDSILSAMRKHLEREENKANKAGLNPYKGKATKQVYNVVMENDRNEDMRDAERLLGGKHDDTKDNKEYMTYAVERGFNQRRNNNSHQKTFIPRNQSNQSYKPSKSNVESFSNTGSEEDKNRQVCDVSEYKIPEKCIFCSKEHSPHKCNKYNQAGKFWDEVYKEKICRNCLDPDHKVETCKYDRFCKCDQKDVPNHSVLLHNHSRGAKLVISTSILSNAVTGIELPRLQTIKMDYW